MQRLLFFNAKQYIMMKKLSQSLLNDMHAELNVVHRNFAEPIQLAAEAVKVVISFLEKLKTFSVSFQFQNETDEIEFFRIIKPQFVSKLIYYNEIYNLETDRPYGGEKALRKFYNNQLEQLKTFFEENLDFYKYYRTGNTYLDKKYFVRGQHDIRLTLDSFYFQADHRFTTSHDYRVAQIIANDQIQLYVQAEMAKVAKRSIDDLKKSPTSTQKWTGSKIALVELIYALHAEGVFNNGSSDLKDVAGFFESSLNVELGQFHRVFLEMRSRKSNRTKFLCSLKETLVRRMDEIDY